MAKQVNKIAYGQKKPLRANWISVVSYAVTLSHGKEEKGGGRGRGEGREGRATGKEKTKRGRITLMYNTREHTGADK